MSPFTNYQHDPKDYAGTHSFEIHNVDVSIVNAIRRVIMTDIEVVGFSGEENPSLEIKVNTGPLHNEFLLQRLGMIPIHLSEQETEAFPADPLRFELAVKNGGSEMMKVTTHHFKVFRNDIELPPKEVHRLFPVHPLTKDPVLITKLRTHEELHVEGVAVKSTAREHAGFQAAWCNYYNMVDPIKAQAVENILGKERAFYCNEYGDPIAIHFDIESQCSLSPTYLVYQALEILKSKVQTVHHEIMSESSQKVKHQKADHHGYEFVFDMEDDTLGNMLQSHIHVNYVRPKQQAPNGKLVNYVGYVCPHPLDQTMILNICLEDDENMDSHDYLEFLSLVCRSLQDQLQDLMNAWVLFAPRADSS